MIIFYFIFGFILHKERSIIETTYIEIGGIWDPTRVTNPKEN